MDKPVDLSSFLKRTGVFALVGKLRPMKIKVRVVGARRAYGRTELQVTPIEGSGETWANLNNVTLDKKTKSK